MFSKLFTSGPCPAKDTMSGKVCGCVTFIEVEPFDMSKDCEGLARCFACEASYDYEELDAISDAAEAAA